MEYIKEYREYLNDNFWKWFGNSKVVDENGNPLVVYHGTSSDFSEFDSHSSSYYFTTNPKYAEYMANMNKRNRQNYNIMPVYLKIEKLKKVDWDITFSKVDEYLNSFEYLNELPDGIVGVDSGSDVTTYVVFNQENIKSAIGNNGKFNLKSTNINENTKQKR